MFKKLLATAVLVCSIPALASAAWDLTAQALLPGGTYTVDGNAYSVTNGLKSFVNYSATTGPEVVVTPNPGYSVSYVNLDGVDQLVAATGGTLNLTGNYTDQSLTVLFEKSSTGLLSITASAGAGGNVTPMAISNVFDGAVLSSPITFRCIPQKGYKVIGITGTTGDMLISPAVASAQISQSVNVIIPAAVQLNDDIAIACSFSTTEPVANAGVPQTTSAMTFTLTGTSTNGSFSKWTAVKKPSATATATFTAETAPSTSVTVNEAGTYQFEYRVASAGSRAASITTVFVVDSIVDAPLNQCVNCHTSNGIGASVYTNWTTSTHATQEVMCADCHQGANTGAHPGVAQCASCHETSAYNTAAASAGKCAACHTTDADIHSANGTVGDVPVSGSCVGCHDVAFHQSNADANQGVRAVVGEFGKWSHHVTGVALNDAHCAACHLEGKVSGAAIVVDTTKHNTDVTDLRNSDDDTAFAWDPASPDQAGMDTFCMSCHDANGAVSAGSVAIQAVINAAGSYNTGLTASALNPFGDTISNQYDQLSRGAVVAVKEQFDTGNSSHHGVRAARYTANALDQTQVDAIIAANVANGETATAIIAAGAGTMPTTATELQTVGTLTETGKFGTLYEPLRTPGVTVKDNTQLHCADCHTVGQFKAGSSMNADGTATTAVIGAHGSENEYMLRNSTGTDNTTDANVNMVCFLCHKGADYGILNGVKATNSHSTAISHTSNDEACNGNLNNSAGQVGSARLVAPQDELDTIATGKYSYKEGSNIFGNKCLNCHNASDNKNSYGGIHGNAFRTGVTTTVPLNAAYKAYSGANVANNATAGALLTAVDRKPYRFLPGLGNFRYNGGVDSAAWTRKSIGVANKSSRMGCYTLNGMSANLGTLPNPAPTKAVLSGTNVSANAIATDNGILGSWGACADHAGTSSGTAGHSVGRTSLRPLTY